MTIKTILTCMAITSIQLSKISHRKELEPVIPNTGTAMEAMHTKPSKIQCSLRQPTIEQHDVNEAIVKAIE